MALYTTQVRTICESALGYVKPSGFDHVNEVLRKSAPLVFNFDFPIWDEAYRLTLESKILKHYYMREIGFETIGLFVHYAKVTMEELMEEYLPLIYSSAIQYDPLVNVDYTESFERTKETENEGSSDSNSSSNASSLGVNSDTPQGQISKQAILSGTYASSTGANENESSVTSESSNQANSNENENYTKRVKGNSGVSATAQKMIEQYRANIRAIDREIIERLNVLFIGLF